MRNFAAFILAHGRPDNCPTFKTLRKSGYTGKIYLICDNEDKTVDGYREKFGAENVIVFDKIAEAEKTDSCNISGRRNGTVYARNASFDIAERLGLSHFWQLDDDYSGFATRDDDVQIQTHSMDDMLTALLNFFDSDSRIASIATSQGGDHIGGFKGIGLRRKAMNSFILSPHRRVKFRGLLNDDVSTYCVMGSVGLMFFTFDGIVLRQPQTQTSAGGMTELYRSVGTYQKSFMSTMQCPSFVRVVMLPTKHQRLHHRINYATAFPCIVPECYRKEATA